MLEALQCVLGNGAGVLFPDGLPRLVTFVFGLPVHVPVPHLQDWILRTAGALDASWDHEVVHVAGPDHAYIENLQIPFVHLRFWQVRQERSTVSEIDAVLRVSADVFPGAAARDVGAPETPPNVRFETVVQAVTQGGRTDLESTDRDVETIAFDRILRALNEFIEGVSGATRDASLAPFAREQLLPIALVCSRPAIVEIVPDEPLPAPPFDAGPVMFLVNGNTTPVRELADAKTLERVALHIAAARGGRPLLTYLRLSRRASSAVASGDYAVAVLMAAASGEVLLNIVLRGMMIEEGKGDELAAMFNPKASLTDRLRGQYAPRLGGSWHLDTWKSAPGHFEQSARWIRHRVIHAGHSPTMDEAVEAVHGTELLEAFLKERLVAKFHVYPKTALSLLGREGLAKRGALSRRTKQTIDQITPSIDAFWAAISAE
jgi:hypothetical protein